MRERLVGALIVVLYTLLMVLLPRPFYHLLVYFLGALSVIELFSLSRLERYQTAALTVFSLLFLLFIYIPQLIKLLSHLYTSLSLSFYGGVLLSSLLIISPLFLSLSLFTYALIVDGTAEKEFFTALVFFIYLTFGIFALAGLSKQFFLLLLSIVWSTDTFAYLVGKYFGRRKLIPSVSPKKTLEGSLGGSVTGTFISYLIAVKLSLLPSGFLTLLLLFLLTIISQVGDLFESSIKRVFGVKDSGNVIPGHGGILDRIDSTLAVAPVLFVVGGLS